jgi:hypothetical protein
MSIKDNGKKINVAKQPEIGANLSIPEFQSS